MNPKSYIPRFLMEPDASTTVVEEFSFPLTATGTSISRTQLVSLTRVTAFAAQWMEIYDQWRLLKVQFRYHSTSATSSTGAVVMYLERDLTEAAVTTLTEGYRQQEAQSFRPYEDFVSAPKLTTLEWNPKDPSDFEYQSDPATVIFNLCVVSEGLPTDLSVGNVQILTRIQFRGRSNPAA